jgi:hypothetical protein
MAAQTGDAKIASIIRNRFGKLRDGQADIFDKVETYNQMYRAEVDANDSWEWDYNLVDPVIFYLIRSMLARLNPDSMGVRLEARTSEDQQNREINQQVLNWELSELNKILLFYKLIYRGLIAGRGYLKTGWKYEKAYEAKDGERKKVMKGITNRANAENVRFQDMFIPNRNIPNLEDQPYIIERISMRYGDMCEDTEGFWNADYMEKIAKGKMFDTQIDYGVDLPQMETSESMGKDLKSIEQKFFYSQYVSLLRMQTLDGDVFYVPEKEKDWILNDDRGNQYWHNHYPYITWAPFPEDDEFFSMGAVQPVADLQIALTSTLNQYLTNARKSGNPMWIAGAAAAQTPDWMFVNRPDGIIRVAGESNQVTQVRTPDTSETMITMRREIMTSFERTTSMSSFFNTGASSGPQVNRTATGAKIIDSNIESSLQMLITLFGAMTLSTMGQHFLELNAQYITEEQEVKITGRNGIEYIRAKPDEITANFDVVANADTMTKTNPVVTQAQLLNLKATMDAEKDVKFDKKAIWKPIINSFPEMDGVDDIIIDPQEQAKDAITDLLNGVEPPIDPTMDHKTIIKLVQVFMLSNSDTLSDEQLKGFTEYLDNQRKYVEAEKVLFTMEQPLVPSDPNAMQGEMMPPADGASPDVFPSDEASLMKSLTSQNQAATNPTNSLPYKLPEQSMQ